MRGCGGCVRVLYPTNSSGLTGTGGHHFKSNSL